MYERMHVQNHACGNRIRCLYLRNVRQLLNPMCAVKKKIAHV